MKISKIYFGSAVSFKGQMHGYIDAKIMNADITFQSGIVVVKDKNTGKQVAVFTSNVKYFEPDDSIFEKVRLDPGVPVTVSSLESVFAESEPKKRGRPAKIV